jgi:DNA invertase Pin-like site-specific DNA recombinase
VSTDRQGASGLGIEAQQDCVKSKAQAELGTILSEYTEVETGKKSDESRPELLKALDHARGTGSTLIIAKLDRLARNTRFLLTLLDSGANVLFCDLPAIPPGATGTLIITVMAAIAQWEAGTISERTKAGLAAYKARGGKLGANAPGAKPLSPKARAIGQALGTARVKQKACEEARFIAPKMLAYRQAGKTYREIARLLNESGYRTINRCLFDPKQVKRVLDRLNNSISA